MRMFSGKDAIKIFSSHVDIFSRVPETFSRKPQYQILFSTLNLIFSKTRLARFLTDDEISDLEENIVNLSKVIFHKFHDKSITVKMHDILVHTIPFVKQYRSIGLFSEQAIESLHQIMNIGKLSIFFKNIFRGPILSNIHTNESYLIFD